MKLDFLVAIVFVAFCAGAATNTAWGQFACSDASERPEVLNVRAVSSWFIELYEWPSKRIFSVEMRPYSSVKDAEAQPHASCLVSEQASESTGYSTVQFRNADIAGGSTFKIRVFWADSDDGTIKGRAGDIAAARCSSVDPQTQTGQCEPWRKIGTSYKFISGWPPDWR